MLGGIHATGLAKFGEPGVLLQVLISDLPAGLSRHLNYRQIAAGL
jgi:hypothetical protein